MAARLLRLRPRREVFVNLIESGDLSAGHAEAHRAQRRRREAARLLPAGPGPVADLVSIPTKHLLGVAVIARN